MHQQMENVTQSIDMICIPFIISSPSQAVLVSTIVQLFFPFTNVQVQLANDVSLSFTSE